MNTEILITLLRRKKNILSEENNVGVFGDNDPKCDRKMSVEMCPNYARIADVSFSIITVQRSLNLGEQKRKIKTNS